MRMQNDNIYEKIQKMGKLNINATLLISEVLINKLKEVQHNEKVSAKFRN